MMKQTDYAGLNHLRDYLRDFENDYVVIGGFATLGINLQMGFLSHAL